MGVMLLKILYLAQIFLWAMPDGLTSVCQALEGFQGQISVKVNGCHVPQNKVCGSNIFVGYA